MTSTYVEELQRRELDLIDSLTWEAEHLGLDTYVGLPRYAELVRLQDKLNALEKGERYVYLKDK